MSELAARQMAALPPTLFLDDLRPHLCVMRNGSLSWAFSFSLWPDLPKPRLPLSCTVSKPALGSFVVFNEIKMARFQPTETVSVPHCPLIPSSSDTDHPRVTCEGLFVEILGPGLHA